MPDRKVQTGTNHVFRWPAPHPLKDATPPQITFLAPGTGAVLLGPVAMTAVGPQGLAVTSVSDGLRELVTAPIPATADALTGPEWGQAWFVSDTDGWFPVQVMRATPSATTVLLADPLPHKVASGGVVSWAEWYVQLTGADVTLTEQRDVVWRVDYSPRLAGEAQTAADNSAKDEGRIHVVRRPFVTGLRESQLRGIFPWLRQAGPNAQQGFGPQIRAANDVLVMMIRDKLRAVSRFEDDLDGQTLAQAHAYMAASILQDGVDPERAEKLRATAAKYVDLALRTAWVDFDGVGYVAEGEAAVEVTGARQADSGGNFVTAGRTPTFKMGQSH